MLLMDAKLPQVQRYDRIVAMLLPPFYLIGLVGHAVDALFPLMMALTPLTIFLTVVVAYAPVALVRDARLALWVIITAAFTLVLEIIGVATGLIFGSYAYGETLGLRLFEVPLVIGLNWTVIIVGCIALMERITSNTPLIIVSTGLLAVGFDWIMEPVAIALDYWTWDGVVVPLHNYVAWGVIAMVFAALFRAMRLHAPSRVATLTVLVQALFFSGLRFIIG
jgi:putative membrane protein